MSTALQVIPAAEAPDLTLMPRADLPAIRGGYDKQKEPLLATAASIIAADPALPATQKLANANRLALRRVRIAFEHTRKELVGGYKKITSAIDAKAREFNAELEPVEAQLMEIEQYPAIQESKRIAALIQERAAFLAEFGTNLAPYNLGAMSQQQFDELFDSEQEKFFAKQKEEKEAEAEAARVAKMKADAADRARIIAENDRLKAEAQAQTARAAAEREQAEAATRAERQAREKVETELRQKEAAEAAKKKADEAAARKAVNAPDAEKLRVFAKTIGADTHAPVLTEANAPIAAEINRRLTALANWIEAQAASL